MRFEPIAIVGSSCVLPGALSPEALWQAIVGRKDLLSISARAGGKRGGYVEEFELAFGAEQVRGLDPLFGWLLHSAHQAFVSSGIEVGAVASRTGAIFGNLSYPSSLLSAHAQSVWEGRDRGPDSRNRFMSGYPARVLAQALGLKAGVLALDAACASSLYAIKFACDRLQEGRADVMLAGGINAAEAGFIQKGFGALQALSPTSRSRPFHREADGLVPAEGAAFLLLKRLEDAVREGNTIQGVIRSIGLSNDGRGTGFLSPSPAGQIQAMRQAYQLAGVDPSTIQLIECHATGTPVGDAVEIESLKHVFNEVRSPIAIGSLKSNLGHSITAAGAAGVIKVLQAMKARTLPPTLHAEEPLASLEGSMLQIQDRAEPWQSRGPLRAAVSGFGFGGVNAHLILEQWDGRVPERLAPHSSRKPRGGAIAVVGLETLVAGNQDRHGLIRALAAGKSLLRTRADGTQAGVIDSISFEMGQLKFPPNDLKAALSQQLLLLKASSSALAQACKVDPARTGVFAGMQCDTESVAKGLLPEGTITAADVIGCMPNIVANRINSQFDLKGPSLTVSLEERSGVEALELALAALRAGELDAAVVGAVDLCCEPAHEAAASVVLGPDQQIAGDAAVAMVLKRLSDAERDGDTVLAILGSANNRDFERAEETSLRLAPFTGHAHAASGLLRIASAVLGCRYGLKPVEGAVAWQPWFASPQERVMRIEGIDLRAVGEALPLALGSLPEVRVLTAEEIPSLGLGRVAIVSESQEQYLAKKARALSFLARTPDVDRGKKANSLIELEDGVYFAPKPVPGEVALVFTGAAAAYPGMGRELAFAYPERMENLAGRMAAMREQTAWIYDKPQASRKNMGPNDKLWATSYLSQLHAGVCLQELGVPAHAAIGLSSGETNALFAFGAWHDMEAMYREIDESGIYGKELSGEFKAAQRAWKTSSVDWTCWVVRVPAERMREALVGETRVYLMIVDSPSEVLIGGQREDCERVITRVGRDKASASSFSLAVHCPVVEEFADSWRKIHTRATSTVPDVRFYTHADLSSYPASREAAAQALTGQALHTIDFPALVQKAWDDGVRVFIEAGPGDFCSGWIRESLGESEHLAVSLDRPSRSALAQLAHAAAALACVGVPVRLDRLGERFSKLGLPSSEPRERLLTLGAHPRSHAPAPALEVETVVQKLQVHDMPQAPALPSVVGAFASRQAAGESVEQLSLFDAVLSVQREMTRAHEQFVGQQRELHDSFLQMPFGGSTETPPAYPSFSRRELEILASGKISSVFGPMFAVQDHFSRQVRMPEPPLLLADRVIGIDAVAGSLGTGRLWSETDVQWDSWYLNAGYMPAGIMIEAGQADLLLISWLGADFVNQGERVYRLLGCDLTYYGGLPQPGDTLQYEIHVDGHADHQGMRIFFFHSECRINGELRQTVRNGQAGFFTDAELSKSAGILWTPESEKLEPGLRLDPPAVECQKTAFSSRDLTDFSEARVRECFGPGFERAETHICTPKLQAGRMLLIDSVPVLDHAGGPWGRGYLRALKSIEPTTWFFDGHFKDDPCMPGTLMFEGCLQAMSFYLAQHGYTLDKDGWRFEPVLETQYDLRCRGQVTPQSCELVYEVFVREIHAGPEPTIYADVLCTVDGLKAFHARRLGLKLKRDWILSARPEYQNLVDTRPVALSADGFEFGEQAILANALGSPAQAFGEMYRDFEAERGYGFPRLPAPPFLFLTRLAAIEGDPVPGQGEPLTVEFEYDVSPEAWYFGEKGTSSLPLCVMIEAALQPCVWISAYMGIPKTVDHPVQCRNLGGTARWLEALRPDSGPLTIRSTVTGNSLFGGTEIQNCDIVCFAGGRKVFEGKSVSGNFSRESLESQAGLAYTPAEFEALNAPGDFAQELAGYGRGELCLPDGALLMAERVTGLWENGGRAGLGRIRAEKDIRPDAWYFKAHFPGDPVQPGSLGLEAIVQTLKFYMLHRGMDQGIADAEFEPIALGSDFSWKYRGQILHTNRLMRVEAEIIRIERDKGSVAVFADAWIWVDSKRIYETRSFGMRIRSKC